MADKDPDLRSTIETRVQTLVTELEALDKKLPSQRKCAASINTAKKLFEDRHQTALETCQRAKAAHLERWTGKRMLTQRVREIMGVLDAAMEEELQYEDAHEQRNTQRVNIATQVHAILDARLLQAETVTEDALDAPQSQQTGSVQQSAEDAVEAATAAAMAAAENLARLRRENEEHLRQRQQDQLRME